MLFIRRTNLVRLITDSVCDALTGKTSDKETISGLKREIDELQSKKKIELEEIKHLIRLEKEKTAAERVTAEAEMEKKFQQKELDIKLAYAEKERQLMAKFHEDVLARIDKEHADMKELHKEIMTRLPNISANLEITKRG